MSSIPEDLTLTGKTPRELSYAQVDNYTLTEMERLPAPSAAQTDAERLSQLERVVDAMIFRQRLLEGYFLGLPPLTKQELADQDDLGHRGNRSAATYEPAERWQEKGHSGGKASKAR